MWTGLESFEVAAELIRNLIGLGCLCDIQIKCADKTSEPIKFRVVNGLGRELRLEYQIAPKKMVITLFVAGQNHPHTKVIGADPITLTRAAEWLACKRELTL